MNEAEQQPAPSARRIDYEERPHFKSAWRPWTPPPKPKLLNGPVLSLLELGRAIRKATKLHPRVCQIIAKAVVDIMSEHVISKGGRVPFRGFEVGCVQMPPSRRRNPEHAIACLKGLPRDGLPLMVDCGPWVTPAVRLTGIKKRLKAVRLRGLQFAPGGPAAPRLDELPAVGRCDKIRAPQKATQPSAVARLEKQRADRAERDAARAAWRAALEASDIDVDVFTKENPAPQQEGNEP